VARSICSCTICCSTRATAAGFSKLSDRISQLEEVLLQGGAVPLQSQRLLLNGPGPGDEELPPPEDEAADDSNRRSRSRLNETAPGKLQSRGGSAGGASNGKGGKQKASSTAGSGLNAVKAGAPGRRAGAASTSPPARRPQSAAARDRDRGGSSQSSYNKENASTGDRYGNVGAIAQAKAQARAAKKRQQHPPYASFEDGASSGSSAAAAGFHFQPKMQLVMHGADGKVTSAQLSEPPRPDMLSPTLPMYPPHQVRCSCRASMD
jgi:hypothetical protein